MRAEQTWKGKAAGVVATVVQLGAFMSLFLELVTDDTRLRRLVEDVSSLLGLPVDENLFIFVVLLVLGAALRRRKRAALWALVLFEIGTLLTSLLGQVVAVLQPDLVVPDDSPYTANDLIIWLGITEACSLATLLLLLALRPAFPAQQAPGAWRKAIRILLGGLTGVIAVGWALTDPFPGGLTDAGRSSSGRPTRPPVSCCGCAASVSAGVRTGCRSCWT
ncbi:hypothetical protein GCM10029964_010330 [Kibdelosporangium lantanae]